MLKGKKFEAAEVRFRVIATAMLYLTTPLRTNEVLLLPVYIRRYAFRARVEDVLLEVNVVWLMTAKLLVLEEKMVVLQTTTTHGRKW